MQNSNIVELKVLFQKYTTQYDAISKADVWESIMYLYWNWYDLAFFHVQTDGYDKAFVAEIVRRFDNGEYPFI